jgi:tagaturonate reductase
LFDITLHGTTKMKVRVIPSILDFAAKEHRVPELIAFGFAAFLLFLRGELHASRRSQGLSVPADEQSARIREMWTRAGVGQAAELVAHEACADESLWGTSLAAIPGFEEAVASHLTKMEKVGVRAALSQLLFKRPSIAEPAVARTTN